MPQRLYLRTLQPCLKAPDALQWLQASRLRLRVEGLEYLTVRQYGHLAPLQRYQALSCLLGYLQRVAVAQTTVNQHTVALLLVAVHLLPKTGRVTRQCVARNAPKLLALRVDDVPDVAAPAAAQGVAVSRDVVKTVQKDIQYGRVHRVLVYHLLTKVGPNTVKLILVTLEPAAGRRVLGDARTELLTLQHLQRAAMRRLIQGAVTGRKTRVAVQCRMTKTTTTNTRDVATLDVLTKSVGFHQARKLLVGNAQFFLVVLHSLSL